MAKATCSHCDDFRIGDQQVIQSCLHKRTASGDHGWDLGAESKDVWQQRCPVELRKRYGETFAHFSSDTFFFFNTQ